MFATQSVQPTFRRGLPTYRRVVLFQAVVVASFSFWLFKEYQNNRYLQEYVQGKIPIRLPLLELVGAFVLVITGMGLYARSRGPRTGGSRVIEMRELDAESPKLEVAAPNVPTLAVSSESDRSVRSSASGFSPVSPVGVLVDAPVLKRIEPPPGLKVSRSVPKPFPVIVRIEPPEESVEEEGPVAPQPVLKRIAPTQLSLVAPSPLGSVRRVGAGLEASGRALIWKGFSEAGETGLAGQGAPVLDKLPPPGREERRAGSEGRAPKKRMGNEKRLEPRQGSRNEQTT